MEERKGLYSSLGKIAWGYALIYLYFNINTIDLLPDWAGWLLIGSALPGVAAAGEPSALLLRPLCWLLAAWEGLCWALEAMGRPTELWGLWLIAAAVSLYVHFQLFTNVVFTTLMHLPLPLDSGDSWLAWPLVAVSLVIIVGTLVVMNTFQASLRDGGVEQE